MKSYRYLLIGFIFLLHPAVSTAQTVTIGGEVPKPYILTSARFQAMKQVSIQEKGHDGKEHTYSGVALADILAQTGINKTAASKKKTVSCYIQLTARDKYKTVLAMAEIDTLFTEKAVILANKIDGERIVKDGPYQLIVAGEKKYGRWIRQVTSIKLFSLK